MQISVENFSLMVCIEAIDIDELEDLKLASKILEQKKLTKLAYHPQINELIKQKKIHVN